MKRSIIILAVSASFALVGCNGNIDPVDPAPGKLVVEPLITRSLSLNFKDGNMIGLDVVKADGTAHAANAPLTYSGTAFSGDLVWYEGGGEACSLRAYFPYRTAGFPETFTVDLDQSKGTDSSDFMTAAESDVYPTAAPVLMKFRHKFAQLNIAVENEAGVELDGVTIKGVIPTAIISDVDGEVVAAADPSADPADIKAEAIVAGRSYCVVIVPQTFESLGVAVAVKNGNVLLSGVEGAELKAGYSYTLYVKVLADQVRVSIGGDIENWEDGGELNGKEVTEIVFEEHLDDGYFIYHDKDYAVKKLVDGNWWMISPMSYVPGGYIVSADPAVESHIWYCVPALEDKDEAKVSKYGYLYDYYAIFGVADINEANYATFEGTRGICPEGWHVPTKAEADFLVTGEGCAYYDTALKYATVKNANADGFGYVLSGVRNKTTLTGKTSFISTLINEGTAGADYPDYVGEPSMNYVALSTGYQCKRNEAGDITNYQFYGIMSTFNNANHGKLNVAYTNVCSGYQVRCVRDSRD